jgi:arylsulfatase A-like enzyme
MRLQFCANRRPVIREAITALLLMAGIFVCSAPAQTPPAHPNIVVILADDLGYGDVSFNGCPDFTTPNIDSLTNNGVRCSNGYVTHPFCSPSRAGLLTGRHQLRFGYENQPGVDSNPRRGIPAQEVLLPQILKPAGYVCGLVGKWNLGTASSLNPTRRGFDEFFGFLGTESLYYNAALLRGTTKITESAYLTDAFTREAVSFIQRHATQPFFLYLAYNAVHKPYNTPPKSYMDRVANIANNSRRIYAAMTLALDDGVGQVLQTLQEQNLLSNTLIFFLSDNGTRQLSFTRNYPLRGYKFNVLEGGIHVPFAVQWPGVLPAHLVYDQPVSSLDIVATVAAATGSQLPNDRVYDGLNLIPYLAGNQVPPQRTLFWRWFGLGKDGPPCDLVTGATIKSSGGSPDTIWAVRSGSLKLVSERGRVGKPPALYNLQADIGETQDLALAQPADVATLKSLYNQWNSQTIPPLWVDNTDLNIMPLVLAGDWNAYTKNDAATPWRLTRITAPGVEGTPDGFNYFGNTIRVAASGGNTTAGVHSFTFVGGNTYSKQWTGATINVDGTTSVPFFSGKAFGSPNSISLEDGYYYSFRILDWASQVGSSMKVAVMKTSAPPVAVRLSGQTPTAPTSNNSVVVSITTSKAKSIEERVYLRWSTDMFVSSHIIAASGSGQNYAATIPAQQAGTGVQYCAVSSTVDLTPVVTSGAIDSVTLATSSVSHFVVASPNATKP